MTEKSRIISEIESAVNNYSNWTIGVTDNLNKRKQQHGNPEHWKYWNAESEKDARDIEKDFLDKGMNGGFGGQGSADWVYIF